MSDFSKYSKIKIKMIFSMVFTAFHEHKATFSMW
nr:MAG TPA: hypothetical protein [Caudoviricetes sp.]